MAKQKIIYRKGNFQWENSANSRLQNCFSGIICCPVVSLKDEQYAVNPSLTYYQHRKNMSIFNINNLTRKSIINYPEKSIYRNDEAWFNKHSTIANFNKFDSTLQIVYQLEKIIYTYSFKNKDSVYLSDIIKLDPNYFDEITGFSFGKNFNEYDLIKQDAENPSYTQVFSFKDTTYIIYSVAVSKDLLNNNLEGSSRINKLIENNYQEYVQVYKGSKKICEDIKVPNDCYGVSYITSSGKLMMPKKKNVQLKMSNETTYNIYEVQKSKY